MPQTEAEIQRQKEMQQAEELLFSGRQELGFAKGLFHGNFVADWVMPYPRLAAAQETELESALAEVRQMLDRELDPDWIDRHADIPHNLVHGLAHTGVLGMTATPSEDGSHFILSGEKRYITNAGIAQVWTVMARTPVPGKPGKDAITAFLVTPDMPGVEMIDPRMPKLGIRGTATARFRLNNVPVPKENILGPLGKGLRVALTVLDFGRTTFGACCAGAAKTCLRLAIEHANSRQQFKKTLGDFDLVKKKIARMAADVYAMEAMTQVTASLIDRGLEDYMIETAMLKVFTTERMWEAVNDAFQIHGGSAYFDDNPLGRILRDARINQIGEGSNEVLTSFIALVGMRGPGMEFKEIYDTMMKPNIQSIGRAFNSGMNRLTATVRTPGVPVRSPELRGFAGQLGRLIWRFNVAVNRALVVYREPVLDMQLLQERIAGAAMELFGSTCTLSRWDAELQARDRNGEGRPPDFSAPDYFLRKSIRHAKQLLAELNDNDDKALLSSANAALGKREDTEPKRA